MKNELERIDRLSKDNSYAQNRRDQGRLLLVALLDNYCQLYDQRKDQNEKLFLEICRYLCTMGILDSTDFIEDLAPIRTTYKRAFKELVLNALKSVNESSQSLITSDLPLTTRHLPSLKSPLAFTDILQQSRFEEDFRALKCIGRGSSGRVLEARNILDNQDYAVKIIFMKSSAPADLLKTLREVKLLASLDHRNVVRFYGSWFQFASVIGTEGDSQIDDEDEDEEYTDPSTRSPSVKSITTSPAIQKNISLFIQMELCSFTLQDYILDLNRDSTGSGYRLFEGKIKELFLDLLHGVDFIHQKKLIHRDIKPSNIYWKEGDSVSGCWKIGDFGIATWSNSDPSSTYQEHTSGLGTITYASPEQLIDGKVYTSLTDIYPLGLILYELLVPLRSGMERAEHLLLLRDGEMGAFETARPIEASLIASMMAKHEKERPSAMELKMKIQDLSPEEVIKNLRVELEACKLRIIELENLLK